MEKHKETHEGAKEQKAAAPVDAEKDGLAKQLAEYKDSLQRLQAEFENHRKRVEKEKVQFRQFAAAEVIRGFLPVLDSFELALKSIQGAQAQTDDKVVKGLELIYAQFYSALESQGLRPINAVGEKLDPYRHEVLMQEETANPKNEGVIAEEFQKGYLLNDAVLRYSKVKVFRIQKIEHTGGK